MNRKVLTLIFVPMLMIFGMFSTSPKADAVLTAHAKLFVADLIELSKFSKAKAKLSTNAEAQKLLNKISATIDFEELAKTALGDRWNTLSETLKQDFLKTLRESIETLLYPRAHAISAPLSDIKFSSAESKPLNVKAKTRFESEKHGEIVERDLELELIYSKAKNRIVDAIIEGELVSSNLKRQFDQALKKRSFEELLTQMKQRLKDAQKPKVVSAPKTPAPKTETKK